MHPILVDTSVLIKAATDAIAREMLKKCSQKFFVLSSEVVETETRKAIKFLLKRGEKLNAKNLQSLYEELISGTVRSTMAVQSLAQKYLMEASKVLSKGKLKTSANDLGLLLPRPLPTPNS